MNTRQLLISITIVVLSTLALYLLIAYHLLRHPETPARAAAAVPAITSSGANPVATGTTTTATAAGRPPSVPDRYNRGTGRKLVEIYGHITDADGRSIENALIAEERYFARTRSDADGYYRILLDLPRHRYPRLHFLRNGYVSQHVRLGKHELGESPVYEFDVKLEDALDSVGLRGWVGNENGIGLEGARVELSASYARNRDSFYLTDFTDPGGNFGFEGVTAGETYKFSVNLTPEYPYYEDLDFQVTQNPDQINVVLQKLHFVDINGMILNRDATPVPDYEMYISNVTTGIHTRKIVSDSSGFFTLTNFPLGEVRLSTRGAEFFKISGLRITDTGYQNLQLVVDRGTHYLSGWVSDENGIAVTKAMVTLDRKFRNGEVEHSSYRSQATDDNGRFAFENLGNGDYHVTVYALGFKNREFTHRLVEQSDEIFVTLKPG